MPARRRGPSNGSSRTSSDGFPRSRRGPLSSTAPSMPSGLERLAAGTSAPPSSASYGLIDLPLEAVYDARFIDSTRRFLGAARDFDPGLSLDFGLPGPAQRLDHELAPVRPRPAGRAHDAVFAYSMVYPYLDNVLDDAWTSESGKLALARQAQGMARGRRAGGGHAAEAKPGCTRSSGSSSAASRVPGSPASTARCWRSTTPRSRACSSRSRAPPSRRTTSWPSAWRRAARPSSPTATSWPAAFGPPTRNSVSASGRSSSWPTTSRTSPRTRAAGIGRCSPRRTAGRPRGRRRPGSRTTWPPSSGGPGATRRPRGRRSATRSRAACR